MPIALILLLVLIGLAVLYVIAAFNRLVRYRTEVETDWSQIDVQLKRRSDLVPNLVELVKDYMDYESETLQDVVRARAEAVSARELGGGPSMAAEGLLGAALGRLFAVAEDYPDLKANQSLTELQDQLTETEDEIAQARGRYNDAAQQLNVMVDSFPSNMVAGAFGFAKAVFFEIDDVDREPVKVDLR